MKFTLLLSLISVSAAFEKCPAYTDPCDLRPLPGIQMEATFFSEPRLKGTPHTVKVNGYYGCSNLVPDFPIRSYVSTASTKVVLHYGKDCIGHVLEDVQGGKVDVPANSTCPGSVFIKFNRYGSC